MSTMEAGVSERESLQKLPMHTLSMNCHADQTGSNTQLCVEIVALVPVSNSTEVSADRCVQDKTSASWNANGDGLHATK